MISVEIKYNTFQTVSHQKQLVRATNTDMVIYRTACELFKECWNGVPIRLLGIRTSKLVDDAAPEQMNLFDFQMAQEKERENAVRKNAKHEKLDKALDEIRKKFGDDAVKRGTFL